MYFRMGTAVQGSIANKKAKAAKHCFGSSVVCFSCEYNNITFLMVFNRMCCVINGGTVLFCVDLNGNIQTSDRIAFQMPDMVIAVLQLPADLYRIFKSSIRGGTEREEKFFSHGSGRGKAGS